MPLPLSALPHLAFAYDVAEVITAHNAAIKALDTAGGNLGDLSVDDFNGFYQMCADVAGAFRRPHLKSV